ncbi:hypothetical protein [Hoyosella altamirensis]|uniref:hypothetical protein n=1 Tax=Hoyosella altamirensis TaxID=616997 RepID=UPI0007DB6702|nr:hypothetical protein [Hoyosella altamirensis]
MLPIATDADSPLYRSHVEKQLLWSIPKVAQDDEHFQVTANWRITPADMDGPSVWCVTWWVFRGDPDDEDITDRYEYGVAPEDLRALLEHIYSGDQDSTWGEAPCLDQPVEVFINPWAVLFHHMWTLPRVAYLHDHGWQRKEQAA